MSVDIVKTAPSSDYGFDWVVVGTGDAELNYHHVIYPCQGIIAAVVALEYVALEPESTLDTSVLLSLFSDRRASVDDVLPHGVTDRRGWCGDELSPVDNDQFGSLLWLGYYTKTTEGQTPDDIRDFMQFAALESLQWMIDTGIASRVVVECEWLDSGRLGIRPIIYRIDDVNPVYNVLWSATLRSHPNA